MGITPFRRTLHQRDQYSHNLVTNPAQTPHALKKLNEVLEDRQNLRGKFSGLIDTLSRMGTQKDTEMLQKTIESSNSALKDAIREQISYTEALNDEVTYQGGTASVFTALDVLSLPLGVFS